MDTVGGPPNNMVHMCGNTYNPPSIVIKKLGKKGLMFETEGLWNLGPLTPFTKSGILVSLRTCTSGSLQLLSLTCIMHGIIKTSGKLI